MRVLVAERDLSVVASHITDGSDDEKRTDTTNSQLQLQCANVSNNPHALIRFEDVDRWVVTKEWSLTRPVSYSTRWTEDVTFTGPEAVYGGNGGYPGVSLTNSSLKFFQAELAQNNDQWTEVPVGTQDIGGRNNTPTATGDLQYRESASHCVTPRIQFTDAVNVKDPEWQRRVKNGEPLYCGDSSFFYEGGTIYVRVGYFVGRGRYNTYRKEYPNTILCGSLLDVTLDSAKDILLASCLVFVFSFMVCCGVIVWTEINRRSYTKFQQDSAKEPIHKIVLREWGGKKWTKSFPVDLNIASLL